MTDESNLRAEIEALRLEIEALRPPALSSSAAAQARNASESEAWHELSEHIDALIGKIGALSGNAEQALIAHPLAGAATALLVGFVAGRLWPRP